MSKWHDYLYGNEKEDTLQSLIEDLQNEVSSLKARSLSDEERFINLKTKLSEIKLKARELEDKNTVLNKKVSILEEDLGL